MIPTIPVGIVGIGRKQVGRPNINRGSVSTPNVTDWPIVIDGAEGMTAEDTAARMSIARDTVISVQAHHRPLIMRLRTDPRELAEAINDFTALELARGIRKLAGEALNGDDTPAQSRTLATLTRAARDLATARSVNATTDAKRPAAKQDAPRQQQPTGALDALETA